MPRRLVILRGGNMRVCVRLALAACLFLSAGTIRDALAGGLPHSSTSATVGGITLTLRLPGLIFPRGALIQTVVKLKNATKRTIPFGVLGCSADGPQPVVDVSNGMRRVVFPPALPAPPLGGAACSQPEPPSAPPGGTASRSIYVLLRGTDIRARLNLGTLGIVRTPYLRVHLERRQAPSISITAAGAVKAVVHFPAGRHAGPLYYTDWYVCGHGGATYVAGQVFKEYPAGQTGGILATYSGQVMDWTKTGSTRLRPGCRQPREWHVAAALLGGSAAYANYVQR